MASFDDAVAGRVDVEQLPGWRYRLSLGEPHPHTDLGIAERTAELWPEAQRRVGKHLGLVAGSYYADLVIPRPEHIRDGDRVEVRNEEGRPIRGRVLGWVHGGVLLDTDEGGCIYPPEEVSLLDEEGFIS